MSHPRAIAFTAVLLVLAAGGPAAGQAAPPPSPPTRAIVELAVSGGRAAPEGRLGAAAAISAQRRAIAAAADRVAARLPRTSRGVVRRFTSVPYLVVEIDAAGRAALTSSPDVIRVLDDAILQPTLAQSAPLIQADQAWDAGYDGGGTTIAILDTGVDASHPFLAGKVVAEACFSSTVAGTSQSACPNGAAQQIGPGAAVPCALDSCLHGTHVAGIAAGNGVTAGQPFSGVARGAHIVAVQVFSIVSDATSCGGVAPCAGAFTSDIIAGLEYVYSIAGGLNVVSANMSLGGATFTAPCDGEPEKPAIDNLRAIGVATVVAAGNNYSGNALSSPACISSAISVGSTDKSNKISYFSNVASFVSLLAPGDSINSSVPGGGYALLSGTSMAAPHVAGAWAIVRQALAGADVDTVLNAFRSTGLPITDDRLFFSAGVVAPRVSIFQALASLTTITNPVPTLTSLSPTRVRAGMGAATLSLAGHAFNALSVAYWNGLPLATTATNTTTLQATVPAAAITGTSAVVTVVNPGPGGGASSPIAVQVDPPAVLSVTATVVPPSTPITATLTNGFGGPLDWLALAQAGSPDTSFVAYTYVGSGVTTRSWTVTMPATPGQYEFRYFPNNGYTRAGTSPAVTVDASLNPVPVLNALSPITAPLGGAAFTLTVTGTGFAPASVVQWNGAGRPTTFVSATQLQAAIGAADIAVAGTAAIRVVTPAPGGGTSNTRTLPVVAPIALAVSATTAAPGSPVTVTLTNGLGGATDWMALAAVAAPATSYVAYTYVGNGVTSRAWTVAMPATPGTYEVRYFPNNGYTAAATSASIAVIAGPAPVPVIVSTSPAAALAGAAGFTLTVTGSSFTSASIVRWNGADRATTFTGSTQLQAAISAADIAAVGTAQVSVFTPAPGGGTSASLPFRISAAPTLSVSATTAGPGVSVTVTLSGGLGGASDWIALAPTSAANTSYVAYTYVGIGVTTRTWTVSMPATPGTYEFRLFPNNGYTRAATSPAITVIAGPPPTLSVSATTAAPGSAVTVTLTGGYGGATDWIALASTPAPNTSYLAYTYVGSGVTTRTWTVAMPSTPGTYEFRLFPNNGYTPAATSVGVTVR